MPVYVAFHKDFPVLTDDPAYVPIHVGKALSGKELDIIGDNTWDNISEKNRNYSELTGIYWAWKNTDSEYAGMCHYCRYFMYKNPTIRMKLPKIKRYMIGRGKYYKWINYATNIKQGKFILTSDELNELFSRYDAVLPLAHKSRFPVWYDYKKYHVISDLEVTKDVMQEKYPDYVTAFDEVMKKKEYFPCNMFIMKRAYFDGYAQWLFDILFEVEKRTDVSRYDAYQKRLYGFLSERLLDVWLTKNKPNIVQLPVLYFKSLKT